MSRPRKFTSELSRARAIEVLRLYESGVKPRDLAQRYDMDANWVWERIKLARRVLAKQAKEAVA